MRQKSLFRMAVAAVVLSGVCFLLGCSGNREKARLAFGIDTLPMYCAHEHWGSISSIGGGYLPFYDGFYSDVYAGAEPDTSVSIWDLVADPYAGGLFYGDGFDMNALAVSHGFSSFNQWWMEKPAEALKGFQQGVAPMLLNGTLLTSLKGIEDLYDVRLTDFDVHEWRKADSLVCQKYGNLFEWYPEAMRKAHFSELIRPVQPEFYLLSQSSETKKKEEAFTQTILRIDPFLDFWSIEHARRDSLSKAAGVDPVDADSWRRFIRFYVDLAEKNHTTGIKSLQAYRRDLDFKVRDDGEVKFRGNLDPQQVTAFQDWVVNEFCRLANEKGWVHQIHVGTNNLPLSNPLPLSALGDRYPNMKIVMLHGWPYLNEVAFLAKNKPNFYIDICWLPVLSPAFLDEALDTYLNYVPYDKIMLSNDATTIEMAVGSSMYIRKLLAEKLMYQKENTGLANDLFRKAAYDMLYGNALRLYGVKK